MARCDECKHWDDERRNSLDDINRGGFHVGQCKRAMPFWDATDWDRDDGYVRTLKPEFADRKFFAQDGFDYRATVYTTPDFFCAEFASVE